jgi:hypothetical protein
MKTRSWGSPGSRQGGCGEKWLTIEENMTSDRFFCPDITVLLRWILADLEERDEILGIPAGLFFRPSAADPFRLQRYGQVLETPLGVAAGPHTQLAQNIVAAWLCGARYIELKTIQVLDELDVTKPCIDMADEGYNCEWSQELRLDESFGQYLDAHVLLYILKDRLGWNRSQEPGFIFNMSAGYNLEGIRSPGTAFFRLHDRLFGRAWRKARPHRCILPPGENAGYPPPPVFQYHGVHHARLSAG